ncbi:hypothetical protein HHL21_05510 [Massilia sp. RP-1-19]|uniref:Uncharacterized protein n=1 Tax=Massilia polaris TaxID=2728846 RepID=A0A848HMQ8_9BURK|nr:hypothetical protein [Massilia polaris]NML60553.1 hypothetical protein [Massilia polaris]
MEHISHIAYIPPPQDENTKSERHYAVVLGIRSDLDRGDVLPYKFEIIINGIISINRKARDQVREIDDMAVKYGYTMLYGQIRERLSGLTSRMRKGTLILPTMSFMDETFPLPPLEDSNDDQTAIGQTPV